MQDYLLQLQRELQCRNYSTRTVEIYGNCLKYFLKWLHNDVSAIFREKVIDLSLQIKVEYIQLDIQ